MLCLHGCTVLTSQGSLNFVGGTDWFHDCGRLLQCPTCIAYRSTTVTAVQCLRLRDWHAEILRLVRETPNDASI